MSQWAADEYDRIGSSEELEITSVQHEADGDGPPWVAIWVVPLGTELYVPSWRGVKGAWYRHAAEQGRARIRVGGLEELVAVEWVPVFEKTLQAAIDAEYRSKYVRYADTYVKNLTAEQARATTLRLSPTS